MDYLRLGFGSCHVTKSYCWCCYWNMNAFAVACPRDSHHSARILSGPSYCLGHMTANGGVFFDLVLSFVFLSDILWTIYACGPFYSFYLTSPCDAYCRVPSPLWRSSSNQARERRRTPTGNQYLIGIPVYELMRQPTKQGQ